MVASLRPICLPGPSQRPALAAPAVPAAAHSARRERLGVAADEKKKLKIMEKPPGSSLQARLLLR